MKKSNDDVLYLRLARERREKQKDRFDLGFGEKKQEKKWGRCTWKTDKKDDWGRCTWKS